MTRKALAVMALWVATLSACSEAAGACPDGDCQEAEQTGRLPFDAAVSEDEACAEQTTRAERGIGKQVDIIFVIDNSGSMTDEIEAVRSNINRNFASIIGESGVDFRVIVISDHGLASEQGNAVCIDPPLSAGRCDQVAAAGHTERFFHYDEVIDSVSSWCKILGTFRRLNQPSASPDGWSAWLRPEAEKAFVVITDDSATCTHGSGETALLFDIQNDPFEDALAFHSALLELSPEQFGVPPDIKYTWYSIVGMQENDPVSEPYFPHDEIRESICSSGATAGKSYQALSIITDALRYPVCEGNGFDAIFQVIARNVIESAKADCVFEIPQAPPRQAIDLLTVTVQYTTGDGGEMRRFDQVTSRYACDARAFFIADDKIRLCPDACRIVEEDRDAQVEVLYACTLVPD